jgi:hypothetical protein
MVRRSSTRSGCPETSDFLVASWIARLKPEELDAASKELAAAGFPNPTIRGIDGKPIDPRSLDKPIDVLMDVEPRNAENMAPAGRAFDQSPSIGSMLARAMAEGKPVASDPVNLVRPNGPVGVVLAAPVIQDGTTSPAGFVTFSYELAPLMLTNDDQSLFSVVLKDPRSADGELIANDQGVVMSRQAAADGPAPSATRIVAFGDRDWSLGYYAKINAAKRAQQTAV